MDDRLNTWLAEFRLDEFLHSEVAGVMSTLPATVREDLVEDPAFRLCDYEPVPGRMFQVPVSSPRGNGASRSVVLKRTLRRRPIEFVRYIIAHELAHAHLRNAGRWPGDDPEHAADALAASWGFPKPA
jgi:hypothetical protein